MRSARARLCALLAIVCSIIGCGGGSAGGGTGGGDGANPTAVTLTFRGSAPAAVAARIGSGSFSAQTASSNTFILSVPSGTNNFAVAFVCLTPAQVSGVPQQAEQTVVELSIADGTAFTLPCGAVNSQSTAPTGTLTGTVDASAIPGVTFVSLSPWDQGLPFSPNSGAVSSFSLAAPVGNDRVEALAYTLTGPGPVGTFNLLAARDFPSQVVPGALNGGNPVVLGPADEVGPDQPITYNNVPSGFSAPSTLVEFELASGGAFIVSGQASTQYPTLPATAVENGDRYGFFATAYSGSTIGRGVSVDMTETGGGPVSVTFPAAWSYGGPAPAALPSFTFDYSGFPGRTGVIQTAGFGWETGTLQLQEKFFLVIASANSQNGSTTLAYPDLSGLAGFLAGPPSGTQVTWSAQVVQSNFGVMQPTPSSLQVSTVLNGGFYVVP